jgi:hypothetical protein
MTTEEIQKVKDFASRCIETLEKDNYARVSSGYIGDNRRVACMTIQFRNDSKKIVSKLVSLIHLHNQSWIWMLRFHSLKTLRYENKSVTIAYYYYI